MGYSLKRDFSALKGQIRESDNFGSDRKTILSLDFIVLLHFNRIFAIFWEKKTSSPVKCREGSKADREWGAMLESRKKAKNPVKNIALNTWPKRMSEHAFEMARNQVISYHIV